MSLLSSLPKACISITFRPAQLEILFEEEKISQYGGMFLTNLASVQLTCMLYSLFYLVWV